MIGDRPRSFASRCVRIARAKAARGRVARAVLAIVHTLAIVLSLQLSGGLHVAADLLAGDTCAADASSERDDRDDECPPGCPTCHACAHAQVPYVSRTATAQAIETPLVLPRDRAAESTPEARPLPPLFRPPRA